MPELPDGSWQWPFSGVFVLDDAPEVPATPEAQDIVDALVALGLVTQAEA